MHKPIQSIIFSLLVLIFLGACVPGGRGGGQAAAGAETGSAGGGAARNSPAGRFQKDRARPVIGFSIATATFIIERWNKDLKVFTGAAQELGADVIVQLSAGGTREQIAQINYMVNQNIDILVVIAHDTEAIAGAIKQVRDAGIPVIAYDRMIMGTPVDAYISFDNREVGRAFGQALQTAAPRGRYLIVNGSLHDFNSFEISRGIHDILDPHIQSGDIVLGKEIWLEEWSFDEALEKIEVIFNEDFDWDAIACGNDAIASAAIQLLSERRRAGDVAVVGQDAELISCQRIVEGIQLMTVYKPIGKLAPRAAQLALAVVRKEDFSPDLMLENNSGVLIPSYIEKPIAVFAGNIDVVIRDGFHSREDVYRSKP
ncbi:D-xylose-binding periplasmic protein [Spirochaetia bacterium]|nr:D-xylose-binding periplasmic protein [Spirochaetia bacterium]